MIVPTAIQIDLQNDSQFTDVPDISALSLWVSTTLQKNYVSLEQTVRVVDEAESLTLNTQFRGKQVPTNVLSFPSQIPCVDYAYLGDLVICAPLVVREANAQGKFIHAHWAHLIIHSMLHLQGFDHENEVEAEEMEALEIKILSTLGYSNPYNST